MSALPPKADIAERDRHVRFVPKADIGSIVVLAFNHSWNPTNSRKLGSTIRKAVAVADSWAIYAILGVLVLLILWQVATQWKVESKEAKICGPQF